MEYGINFPVPLSLKFMNAAPGRFTGMTASAV
jgi:hypothetical protein